MARASRKGPVDVDNLPKGMKVFIVTGATIKDSTGAYCTEGQQAVLNEKDAQRYHKARQIAADLPDFNAPKGPSPEEAQAALDALDALQAQMAKEREAFAKQIADKEEALAKATAGAQGAVDSKPTEKGDDGAGEPGASEGGEAAAVAGANRRQARA